ncbi:oligosaccharide flippase family protein [Priestia endophytica]|uniref:oligosaccharide flippase family protein n=1 Tax=Priestia endophytica TaxID=135735 RepID=UPI000F54C2FF|nr:oligosaccharide flippase family protein [Priestia endophytica]RPK15249.1 hypothetical protein FH5_00684 [Priestia endophytica]
MTKLKKNFILVLIQQFFLLGLPFLTIPYISRVLGPEGVGLYSYSFSIVTLFINIALLGSQLYAVREVAKVKDEHSKLSKVFSEIFIIRTGLILVSLVVYLGVVSFVSADNIIFLLQALHLIGTLFDITWFFQGIEDFKKVVTRNIFIKLLGFLSVFIFVKDEDDLIIYTLIMAASVLLGNIVLFYKLNSKVTFKFFIKSCTIRKHIKHMVILFIPSFSVMIYSVLDKTMLGSLSTTSQLGFYEQGSKLVLMIFSIVGISGTVMLPRSSALIADNNLKKLYDTLKYGINLTLYLVIPLTLGLIIISEDFVLWFLGNDFQPSASIVVLMAPIIIFKSIGVIFGSWYFVPMEKNKEYTLPIVLGAILNFILNLVLIPEYKATGAATATLITELIILIIQIYFLRSILDIRDILVKGVLKYLLISGITVCIVNLFVNYLGSAGLISIILKVSFSISIYGLVLFVIRDKLTLHITRSILKNKLLKKNLK